MKRLSIFLITVALIAGMAGCDGTSKYSLTMAVAPSGGGMATDLTNASPYAAGTVVTIKAEANKGYLFAKWEATAGKFANANFAETTFTMPAQDVIVTADFVSPLISTWYDLDAARHNLSGNYSLINDLDSTTPGYEELASPTANEGKGWDPIGSFIPSIGFVGLRGSFDGQGYEIRDLFINRPNESLIGLFGVVGEGGVIKNIGMVNVTVTGCADVGGLVGWNRGTVSYSYSTGNVTGHGYYTDTFKELSSGVGGLVGSNFEGTVSNSYSAGNVTGEDGVGGLVGGNVGTVSNSYSTSRVIGEDGVGGLVGWNGVISIGGTANTVSNSYSTGNVTGNYWYAGGLVGLFRYGIGKNNFWDTETSGRLPRFRKREGGTGKTTTEMQDFTTFSGAGWNITAVAPNQTNNNYTWNIVDKQTYPFLGWEL